MHHFRLHEQYFMLFNIAVISQNKLSALNASFKAVCLQLSTK